MTFNIIMGKGNLGTALSKKFERENMPFLVFNRPELDYITYVANDAMTYSEDKKVVVWNTEGYGSVPECRNNPAYAYEVHVMRNLHLLSKLAPEIHLVNFSTNYVGQRPKSEYASSKAAMESLTKNHPRERVVTVRVANLYSKYFPLRSFQGKLLLNRNNISKLPWNRMTPTDCDWLSDQLCDTFLGTSDNTQFDYYNNSVISLAPRGSVSAREFGQMILGKELDETHDDTRPDFPTITNLWDIEETWLDVWEKAKPEFMTEFEKAMKCV